MELLVLDGNSIINRAFYGIKGLSTKKGVPTNGIYGFLTVLLRLQEETRPDAVAIAFDLPDPTFRHLSYEGYKAGRKGMPEELAAQMPLLKTLLEEMGYRLVTCSGYEADDILGTLARACGENGDHCLIATGDRDSLQLVSGSATVRLASTKFGQPQVTRYDEAKVMEEYGVTPQQLIDIKAIQGDSSDNIPGVAGIGPKGAGALVKRFGTLDEIYRQLEDPDIKPGIRAKLEKDRDRAYLSYDLGRIRTDAPIETKPEAYRKTPGNPAKAAEMMLELELFSLLDAFGYGEGSGIEAERRETAETPEILTLAEGAQMLPRTEDAGAAYFCTEYRAEGGIQRMVFAHAGKLFSVTPDPAFLRAFFRNDRIRKYTHDSKALHKAAGELGIPAVAGMAMDSLLAAYLLNPSGGDYDIGRLAAAYRLAMPALEDGLLKAAAVMPALCGVLEKEIEENKQEALLREIELPLAAVLAQMETVGFGVDRDKLIRYGEDLSEQIEALRSEILSEVGYEFNLNSPKQLGEALFDKLGLPHGKKTKTGWSTNAKVLEELSLLHPVVAKILAYRTLAKLKSTYCDGLVKAVGPDGRIHSSFNQTETRTGRISSTEPNLQNIPVRTPVGRELRRFFTAETGVLVDADYSQIELRVLAAAADDTAMKEDFAAGRDIHRSTAARVFGMPPELVTPEMRSSAKAVNFGIVYGIGAFSLSKDIGVSVKEAGHYIDEYLRNYAGVDAYMKKVVETARETGYVETLFGRRRYLPELKSGNFNNRAFGERVARNMPIQGTAADIIKIAMIRVSDRLAREGLTGRLILQVHDELIVECPESEGETVKKLLQEEMEQAVKLSVPMQADANIGKTWYDAKG